MNPTVNAGTADATQGTSTATAVTANSNAGTITCFTSTLAALTAVSFTVNNSSVGANSTVTAAICGYAGTVFTDGTPYCFVNTVANGSFVVTVCNLHATVALAGVLKISYRVS